MASDHRSTHAYVTGICCLVVDFLLLTNVYLTTFNTHFTTFELSNPNDASRSLDDGSAIEYASTINSVEKSIHILTNACFDKSGLYVFNLDGQPLPNSISVHTDMSGGWSKFDISSIASVPSAIPSVMITDTIPYITYVTQFNNVYHFSFSVFLGYVGLLVANSYDKRVDLGKIQLFYSGHYASRFELPLLKSLHGIMSNFTRYPYQYYEHTNEMKCYHKIVVGRLSHYNMTIDNFTTANDVIFEHLISSHAIQLVHDVSPKALEFLQKINHNSINILLLNRNPPSRHLQDMHLLQQSLENICTNIKSTLSLSHVNQIIEYRNVRHQQRMHYDYVKDHNFIYYDYKHTQSQMQDKQEIHCNIISTQFESKSLVEQFVLSYYADILIGPHGAGLAWSLYQSAFSVLVELFPSNTPKGNCHPCVKNLTDDTLSTYNTWTLYADLAQWHGSNPLCVRTKPPHPQSWKNTPFNIGSSNSADQIAQSALEFLGIQRLQTDFPYCKVHSCKFPTLVPQCP
eukprot:267598_1